MPGVLEIIKRRWPEVLLIVVFQAGALVLMVQFEDLSANPDDSIPQMSPVTGLFLSTVIMIFALLCQMLILGFVATAYYEGSTPQQPARLVKVGRYFFWRMVRFQLLFGLVCMILSAMIFSVFGGIFFGGIPIEDYPEWFKHLCFLMTMAALAKPMLIMPAEMIVADCMVLKSVSSFWQYELRRAKTLLKLFAGGLVVLFLLSLPVDTAGEEGFGHYAALAVSAVVAGFLTIVINLEAVLFVGRETKAVEKVETTERSDEFEDVKPE